MLFHIKKEENSETCYNMGEPWGHDASEINQSQNTVGFHFNMVPRVVKFIKTGSRMVATRG